MATGVPVIASRVDGNAEIIKDNENGILVQPGFAQEFAKAAIELMSDEKHARKLKNMALKTIDEYSVHTMVQQIDELYQQTLK